MATSPPKKKKPHQKNQNNSTPPPYSPILVNSRFYFTFILLVCLTVFDAAEDNNQPKGPWSFFADESILTQPFFHLSLYPMGFL